MDFGIAGRRAIVGGASAGLGKACAMSLAREGVEVTIVARTLANIEAAAEEIRAATGANVTWSFDCAATACTAAVLGAYDPATCQSNLKATVPGAVTTIVRTSAANANPATYTIRVDWTEQRDSVTYATAGATEPLSYVTTKTVLQ